MTALEEASVAERIKVGRDAAIVAVALGLLVFEIVWGGARPSALTAITSLLLSPLVLRIDEARKGRNGKS